MNENKLTFGRWWAWEISVVIEWYETWKYTNNDNMWS